MEVGLFAGVAVRDLDRAIAWYDALLGDVETSAPNDTEWVWTIAPRRHLYVDERPGQAGHGMVTLFVDDHDAFVAAASARGVVPERTETYDNGVRKTVYHDPDGNEVGIGGAPVDAEPPAGAEVSALAINVAIPEELQWTASRRDTTFRLNTLNVRLLPDGRVASKAYGRPVEGGRSGYVAFPVPDTPEVNALVAGAARTAGRRWASATTAPSGGARERAADEA